MIGRLTEPLLSPNESEREGYVPNVVYTCGAMRHNDQIILPYAVSDTYSRFATIEIAALMQRTPSFSKSQLARGTKKLRAMLEIQEAAHA